MTKKVKEILARFLIFMVVHFKIHWPAAVHAFMRRELTVQYKNELSREPKDELRIQNSLDRLMNCLKNFASRRPSVDHLYEWINSNRFLGEQYLFHGDNAKSLDVCRRTYEIQNDIFQEHQTTQLGFQFIPRAVVTGNIGVHEFLEVHVKAAMLGLVPLKKMILLLDPKSTRRNRCYLDYWRRYVTVITDSSVIKALEPLEKMLTMPITFYLPVRKKVVPSRMALGTVREEWIKAKRPPLLSLSQEDRERGGQCLNDLGVPKDAWFVCLHVRESGWNDTSSSPESFRNADIDTYMPAIKAITSAGGWVIRVGDSGMRPLPEMEHVIDYAHSSAKSDWMDIFLFSQCRFFLGTSSGPYTVAMAFGVPVILTNLLPAYAMYYLSGNDLFIPGLCWSEGEAHLLNFEDLIALPVGETDGKSVNNKPEDILKVVEEMLHKVNGTLECSREDETLQGQFRAMAARCSKLYGNEETALHARIGKDFLRKYAALLGGDEITSVKNEMEGARS